MNLKGILTAVSGQYDKLIAGLMAALLLASVVYLGVRLHAVGVEEERTRTKLEQMKPEYPDAAAADLEPYSSAKAKIAGPDQIGTWTNALLVPEMRVWCVDCRRPIELTAKVCPFCKTRQPPPPKEPKDKDQDGILDEWEREHGLNPADPTDAAKDPDGDGFTNLEEFMAEPQTDPQDGDDHPSYAAKLCVEKITATPFRLLFKSVIKLPDGNQKFAVNDQVTGKTYFKALDEDIEGFELHKFEEHFEEETSGGVVLRVNRSILTLKLADKLIPLTMGKRVSYVELTVDLLFRPDGSRFTLKMGGIMEVRGKEYKVLRIDSERDSVVLERLSDEERLVIVSCNGRAK